MPLQTLFASPSPKHALLSQMHRRNTEEWLESAGVLGSAAGWMQTPSKLDGPHTGQEERCGRVGASVPGLGKTGDKSGKSCCEDWYDMTYKKKGENKNKA